MKKFILLSIMLGAISSTMISCGSPPKKDTDLSSTSPDINDLGSDTALYINVGTRWESEDETAAAKSHKTCSISSMAPTGYSITCNVKIPEGQMYYSDILFTTGTKLAAICPLVTFRPYYYIRSLSATYTPANDPTGATVDCSDQDKRNVQKACWGGAAPHIIDDFPKNKGRYHLTGAELSKTYTLDSPNSIRWESPQGGSNLIATNNLPSGQRNSTIAGKNYYVDASNVTQTVMRDYVITCEDLWAHPIYSINLNVLDEDTKDQDGTLDEIEDWQ